MGFSSYHKTVTLSLKFLDKKVQVSSRDLIRNIFHLLPSFLGYLVCPFEDSNVKHSYNECSDEEEHLANPIAKGEKVDLTHSTSTNSLSISSRIRKQIEGKVSISSKMVVE